MRDYLALLIGGALLLGCAGESGSEAASGGAGGAAGVGGRVGTGGASGAGGEAPGITGRVYVSLLPIPPCQDGTASSYSLQSVLVGPGSLEATFPSCTKVPEGDSFTLMCPMDAEAIDYAIVVTRGGGRDLRVSGAIDVCSGFLLRDVIPAKDEVVVDVFVAPEAPCERGVPSDYTVDVFVDGAAGTAVIEGDLGNCTGTINSLRNILTCPNDEAAISYSITIGKGLDWEVSILGAFETCSGFLTR